MVARKSSPLGKGLKALLPASLMDEGNNIDLTAEMESKINSPYFLCPINFITANPYQPRKEMDSAALGELASSIKEKGILQPIIVRRVEENSYELIAGERRLRAAKLAGLEKVPVIAKDIAMSDRLELALIENIQRENLNVVEEGLAYAQLMDEFGMTQESVAKRVGKDRSTIANTVRLLQLPDDVIEDLGKGLISAGHARVLLSLADPEKIRSLRDEIINKKLSVRETEAIVKRQKASPIEKKLKKEVTHSLDDSYCKSLSNSIVNYLDSKTKIVQNGQRGKIEIEYYSPDDLERVLSLIITE
jgi:ParB family chromosome partitioning protein